MSPRPVPVRPVVWLRALLAVGLLAVGLLAAGAPAQAGKGGPPPGAEVPPNHRHQPWFGQDLQPQAQVRAFEARSGAPMSLDARSYAYPLAPADVTRLEAQARESVATHTVALVTLMPRSLGDDGSAQAAVFAAQLGRLARGLGGAYLIRFAPEMNLAARRWGLRPLAFVHQFRALGDAVHAATGRAAMVWSPADGARDPRGAHVRPGELTYLDTDRNGRLDAGDDPYGPYYPGSDVADWVGLTVVPGTSEPGPLLSTRLAFAAPTLNPRVDQSFYARYVTATRAKFLLVTGHAGPAWQRQVFAAGRHRALLGAVLWTGGSDVATLGGSVAAGNLDLGPVRVPTGTGRLDPLPAAGSASGAASHPTTGVGPAAWVGGGVGLVLLAGLGAMLLVARARRVRPDREPTT